MLLAQHGMWYDNTCEEEDGECLFAAATPRVVPGDSDRTIYVYFHYSYYGNIPWIISCISTSLIPVTRVVIIIIVERSSGGSPHSNTAIHQSEPKSPECVLRLNPSCFRLLYMPGSSHFKTRSGILFNIALSKEKTPCTK